MKLFFQKLSFKECSINKLKKERDKRNLTLEQLSRMTNIPRTTLTNWEKGKNKKIPLEGVKKIAKTYEMNYRYFYGLNVYPLIGTITGILISLSCGLTTNTILAGVKLFY